MILYIFCIGCATGNIFIDTLPQGSDVYIKSSSTSEFILIGKSPLNLKSSQLKDTYKLTGPIAFMISRDNYLKEYTYLTELPYNSDINMTLILKSENDPEKNIKLNRLMDALFENQRLVQVGRYEDALKGLDKLQIENPQLSVIYEMQAGIYYMQKDFSKSLDSYELATRLNPESLELQSMKKYLKKKVEGGNGQ
jgi:tetratricopeptide (TPR) repeat protein